MASDHALCPAPGRRLMVGALVALLSAALLSACATGGDEVLPIRTYPAWVDEIEIGRRASWDREEYLLVVTPTMVDGSPYTPYDLSDAWRELDRMLPTAYLDVLESYYSATPVPDPEDDRLDLHSWHFVMFLQYLWLDPEGSRLATFFEFFDPAPDPSSELYRAQLRVLTLMIVRGYVARYQSGERPSIADLSEFARSGLEWHATPRGTFD